MLYDKSRTFKTCKLAELLDFLKTAPQDYIVYAQCVDSIYPVSDMSNSSDSVAIFSVETYGKRPKKTYTVAQFIAAIEDLFDQDIVTNSTSVYLEPAENTDPDLDAQLTEARAIGIGGISDICQDVYLVAGELWDFVDDSVEYHPTDVDENIADKYKYNSISVADVIHTLREMARDDKYNYALDHMITFASELTGLSEDRIAELMR